MVFAVASLSILCQILLSQCHHAIVLALCWPESLLEFHGNLGLRKSSDLALLSDIYFDFPESQRSLGSGRSWLD